MYVHVLSIATFDSRNMKSDAEKLLASALAKSNTSCCDGDLMLKSRQQGTCCWECCCQLRQVPEHDPVHPSPEFISIQLKTTLGQGWCDSDIFRPCCWLPKFDNSRCTSPHSPAGAPRDFRGDSPIETWPSALHHHKMVPFLWWWWINGIGMVFQKQNCRNS